MAATRRPKEPGESFVVTSLDDGGFTLRPLLWGASLVLVVAVVAASVVFFARHAAPATPRRVAPTGVPTTALPAGWHEAGPLGTQAVAFAPSDAAIGYACGRSAQGIFTVRTQDGGNQWTPPALLNDPSSTCSVAVDPTAPDDVVVNTGVVWRSTNAGATWHALALPNVKPGLPAVSTIAWAGGTLFAAFAWSPYYQHTLVASVAGGPFVAADPPLVALGGDPSQLTVQQLFGAGGSIYIGFSTAKVNFDFHYARRLNVGQTWQPVRFAKGGLALFPVAETPDDRGIIAQSSTNLLALTYDGGATWTTIAAPNQGLPALLPAAAGSTAAPDGTLIAEFRAAEHDQSNQTPVQFLFSQHGQWVAWSSHDPQHPIHVVADLTLTWDSHGHATHIWGIIQLDLPTTATTVLVTTAF